MKVNNFIGDVESLSIYYEGSGDPDEDHKIIGIKYWTDIIEHTVGECPDDIDMYV